MPPIDTPATQSGSSSGLVQCLIHPGLVGAEGTAAFKTSPGHANDGPCGNCSFRDPMYDA